MSDKPTAQEFELRHDGPAALVPPPEHGEVIEATIAGTDLRVTLRYGTSPLGTGWQVVSGDWLGQVPTDSLTDIVRKVNE